MSESKCSLIPGAFGILVQFLLFIVSMSVLILKKKREERYEGLFARSWPVFLLDSSKQLIGAGMMHALNLATAEMFGNGTAGDACEWYWVNIVLDTTVGVAVAIAILKLILIPGFEHCFGSTGDFLSGEYKDDLGTLVPRKFFAQLACWLLTLTLTKLVMILLMLALQTPLQSIARGFMGLFGGSTEFRLVLVMVITPCIMNALQFWVQDAYLRHYHIRSEAILGVAARTRPLRLDTDWSLDSEPALTSGGSGGSTLADLPTNSLPVGKLPRANDPNSMASSASTETS